MPFLRNAWYVIGFQTEFTEKPIRRQILGEWMAIFRDENGTLCAVEDRCPHRFVPLSMGKVEGSQIRCGYHGLAFSGHDGKCTDRPMDDEGPIPPKLCIKAYPTVEKHLVVWAWMGAKEKADPALIADFGLLDNPNFKSVPGYIHMKANQGLIADNLLDLSHVQFLHPHIASQGDLSQFQNKVETEATAVWSRLYRPSVIPNMFQKKMWGSASERGDSYGDVRFSVPGNIMAYTSVVEEGQPWDSGLMVPSAHLLTPETEYSTHYFWTAGRNALQEDEALDKILHDAVYEVFSTQDGPMIEAQQEAMGESTDFLAHNPVILKPDAAGIRARRMMNKLIREEQAGENLSAVAAE
ncbi:aromatic ring-hydroxylating dioxygenase subunit alpha [Sphingomonas crocodyli]|uniref:Aromatic ring-hydroxylating dioxygenase subunit alpha n=1 Tax=Sphingomonas crocodyli TaxID=1979270 RepID=A0A437LWH2_9SPHN|nr:aromatic ring-hydroxylating dioxygenase subunit alpha [Sphingomonas crocodyli]RVT89719.1 aromatic ring-hydroxylating dioxygenase subunit alpha [Sphingomonas crocodyli]